MLPEPRRLVADRGRPQRGNRHADRRRQRPRDRAGPRPRARAWAPTTISSSRSRCGSWSPAYGPRRGAAFARRRSGAASRSTSRSCASTPEPCRRTSAAQSANLTPTEFRLLYALALEQGRVADPRRAAAEDLGPSPDETRPDGRRLRAQAARQDRPPHPAARVRPHPLRRRLQARASREVAAAYPQLWIGLWRAVAHSFTFPTTGRRWFDPAMRTRAAAIGLAALVAAVALCCWRRSAWARSRARSPTGRRWCSASSRARPSCCRSRRRGT